MAQAVTVVAACLPSFIKSFEAKALSDYGKVLLTKSPFSVMEINALLVRIIFDKNQGHEFYIEESYPLDWMYPYLSPHGLIFQLKSKPLAELSGTEVQKIKIIGNSLPVN
jgi:hypothetical protein